MKPDNMGGLSIKKGWWNHEKIWQFIILKQWIMDVDVRKWMIMFSIVIQNAAFNEKVMIDQWNLAVDFEHNQLVKG